MVGAPSAAFAAIESQPVVKTGSTYYSNVPGWSFRFETWYYPKSTTSVAITKQVLNGTLSSKTMYAPLSPYKFYNKSGYVGPITASIKSNGTTIYTSTKTGTYWRAPGESVSFTWWPSKTGVRYHTYGMATITWGQILNNVYDSALSSPKPCVIRSSTF